MAHLLYRIIIVLIMSTSKNPEIKCVSTSITELYIVSGNIINKFKIADKTNLGILIRNIEKIIEITPLLSRIITSNIFKLDIVMQHNINETIEIRIEGIKIIQQNNVIRNFIPDIEIESVNDNVITYIINFENMINEINNSLYKFVNQITHDNYNKSAPSRSCRIR